MKSERKETPAETFRRIFHLKKIPHRMKRYVHGYWMAVWLP